MTKTYSSDNITRDYDREQLKKKRNFQTKLVTVHLAEHSDAYSTLTVSHIAYTFLKSSLVSLALENKQKYDTYKKPSFKNKQLVQSYLLKNNHLYFILNI